MPRLSGRRTSLQHESRAIAARGGRRREDDRVGRVREVLLRVLDLRLHAATQPEDAVDVLVLVVGEEELARLAEVRRHHAQVAPEEGEVALVLV